MTATSGCDRIRLGVSACLLGESVRYDGGHKRNAFLVDVLGPFVEWVPVCPEVELGLGVPRDTLRLTGDPGAPRLVVERTGKDITRAMERWRRLPALPVEEEDRLDTPVIRESFIERIFAASRWRAFRSRRRGPRDLVAFHSAQVLAVAAHSPRHAAALGRLVGRAGPRLASATVDAYGGLLMEALAVPATRARHVKVLRHHVRRLGLAFLAGQSYLDVPLDHV